MQKIIRRVFVALALLVPIFVFANQPPLFCKVQTGNTYSGGCDRYFESRTAASDTLSNEAKAAYDALNASAPLTWGGSIQVPAYAGPNSIRWARNAYWMNGIYQVQNNLNGDFFPVCPVVNGTRATPGAVEATACPGDTACVGGTVGTFNTTAGWWRGIGTDATYPDRMPDGSVPPNGYTGLPPETMCINGCQHTRGEIVGAWTSKVAVNGMYRISDDWKYTSTAMSCTQTTAEAARLSPTSSAPPCDGSVGVVNGKSVCVPSSLGQTNSLQGTKPPTVVKEGNPTAGSAGGTGNIPSTGTGTNSGGPSGAGDGSVVVTTGGGPGGTGGTGTTTTATGTGTGTTYEFSTCGLPGKPACKIDETGVPGTATTSIDIAGMTAAEETRRGTISGTGDKNNLFSGFAAYFAIPPLATCQPIPMPVSAVGVQIPSMDPCATVDGIRSFMGYLWALAGLYLCVGFVRKAIA